MSTPQAYEFDVFLSHNSADKPKVRWLAGQLKDAGFRVWFDEWVIRPGDDIFLTIEHGLQSSRCLALCISSNALASDWVALERSTALFRDPINKGRRFLPLLLSQCEVPDTLRRYRYIDLSSASFDAIGELISALAAGGPRSPHSPTQFIAPVSFVTDSVRLLKDAAELDFSIWNGNSRRILLTSVGLQEYYEEQTMFYSGYHGRYGLDLRVQNDLKGLSYKIDPDDVLPFTVKLAVHVHGGGYIKIFGLHFAYSDASGKTTRAASDAIFMVGAITGTFVALGPENFSALLDSTNPDSPAHGWVDPYPRDFYERVVAIHAKHRQSVASRELKST